MGKKCSLACNICRAVSLLVSIGAINWGLVGALDFDIVTWLSDLVNFPPLDQILYLLIGVAGCLSLYKWITRCGK